MVRGIYFIIGSKALNRRNLNPTNKKRVPILISTSNEMKYIRTVIFTWNKQDGTITSKSAILPSES